MERIKAFEETTKNFIDDFNNIKTITNFEDLSALELRMVRELQLAQVQVGRASQDLYIAIQDQKRAIDSGEMKTKKEVKKEAKKEAKLPKMLKKAKK